MSASRRALLCSLLDYPAFARVRVIVAALQLALVSAILLGAKPNPRQELIAKWGLPGDDFCYREGYALAYDSEKKSAGWTVEVLDADSLVANAERKGENFSRDAAIPAEFSASPSDYEGFDKGHSADAGNHRRTTSELDGTFLTSNTAPQLPWVNRVPLAQLGRLARKLARRPDVGRVWVATGQIFAPHDLPPQGEASTAGTQLTFLGKSHVWVPTHIVKSFLWFVDGVPRIATFVVPNRDGAADRVVPLDRRLMKTDLAEHYAGRNLWPQLPEADQRRLEAQAGDGAEFFE